MKTFHTFDLQFYWIPGSLYVYVSCEKNLGLSIDFTVGESANEDWHIESKKNDIFENFEILKKTASGTKFRRNIHHFNQKSTSN